MKKFFAFFLMLFIFSIFTIQTAGAVVLETGENVVITQNILDDAYIVAGNANIEAEVYGDLYILGGSVTVNSTIKEDLVIGGGKVTVIGDVMGDLRIAGGQVSVYGNVGDDIVVAGGQVDIGKGSTVGGSLVSGAGMLTVDGNIKEDIRGGMGGLFLNGTVGKDVIVTVEDSLVISENAKIKGDLKYSSLIEATIPENVVSGEIAFNKFERESILEDLTYIFFVQKILSFISSLILAGLLIFFASKALMKAAKITRENIFRAFGVGLLTVIVAGIACIILMITVVGIPIGLIMLATFVIILYLSKIFVSVWLAGYVLNYNKKVLPSRLKLFLWASVAILAYYLVGMIPYVGWVVNLVLFLIGVGTIVLMKMEYFKFLKGKNMV